MYNSCCTGFPVIIYIHICQRLFIYKLKNTYVIHAIIFVHKYDSLRMYAMYDHTVIDFLYILL